MNLAAALRANLSPRPPATVPGLVAVAGGRPFQLARIMNGIGPGARLPAKGSARRRRYDADKRWVERQLRGDRRTPDPGKLARARARVAPHFTVGYRARLAAAGARMRLSAMVSIAGYPPVLREMPAGGPGALIGPAVMSAVVTAGNAGSWPAAAALLESAFWAAYGPDGDVVDVLGLKLWPEGSPEPA